ncbi:MAG: efflux RND transporter periplasmic adaptor subunit [Thermodesulfobacteriota bacterium]|nr:efflux RND transporter periplasmic adaptor subunit [Thermodesulfobacteriota bacterium]
MEPSSTMDFFLKKILYSIWSVVIICTFVPPFTVQAQDSASPVKVGRAENIRLPNSVHLTGTVVARRASRISAEVDGLVAELLVDEGDFVKQGDPLLRIRVRPKELELAAEKAELERANAAVTLAELKESRQSRLLESEVTAQDTYDIANAELRQVRAMVSRSLARVSLVQDEINRHEISAPFDGVIGEKHTDTGSWVHPGDIVFTLEEIGVVRVKFPLPQVYYGSVKSKTPVSMQFDALPGEIISSGVTRKIPVADEASRTFTVHVDIENPDYRIAPGMSVDVTVQVAGEDQVAVLTVPIDSVIMRPDGSELVWVVISEASDLTVAPHPVKTGRANRERVEIVFGELQSGDHVVVFGNERLRRGQKVRIVGDN